MTNLKKANSFFRARDYQKALDFYYLAVHENPSLESLIKINLKICDEKNTVVQVRKENPIKKVFKENEIDMHGEKIKLYPKPCYQKAGYRLDKNLAGAVLNIPYGSCNEIIDNKKALNVGVHIHIFYESVIDEFIFFLKNIVFEFTVYFSVVDEKTKTAIEKKMKRQVPQTKFEVKVFENRGRDIAHFIVGFGDKLLQHDIIGHFHSKRSPHNFAKKDWRRQLLVPLMGSELGLRKIFEVFSESPNVGMLFPAYHYSLKGQISWGTNFEVSEIAAKKIGVDINPDEMTLFPAGSMFWARKEAIKRIFEAGFTYESFPKENAQVDGTLAHAIERLFGEIVYDSGYELIQIDTEKQHNLIKYFPAKFPYHEEAGYAEKVKNYIERKKPNNKVVVYTALSGGYEELPRLQHINPNYDYVAFCDEPISSQGVWDVRPMDFWHPDKVRMARRVKTNPHVYLKGYELAIWIDANVIIENDIGGYVQKFVSDDTFVAGIPHPIRNCVYHEAKSILEAKKDSGYRVERQISKYRKEKYPEYNGLIETNLMMFKLNSHDINVFFDTWWSEISKYSHRDQLSVNYALCKAGIDWHVLMSDGISLRDNFDFAYLGHGKNSGYVKHPSSKEIFEKIDPYRKLPVYTVGKSVLDSINIDIVVCVHNALEDVRICLDAVIESRRDNDNLIIIDDCSNDETKLFLDAFHRGNSKVILHRNTNKPKGYCRAANIGMSLSKSKYFLLLNSDTKITRASIENMLHVALQSNKNGIVGPMSNAASSQSIPDIKNTTHQTAVNELPKDISIDEMNALCEEWSFKNLYPTVPLVHGFCQLIKRSVYEAIGGFDEASFPEGYGEENDFCLRAVDAGYDLKVATNSFVFHKKSASYSDVERRSKLMKSGNEMLKKKHGEDRLAQSIKIMEGHSLLMRMRHKANDFFIKKGDS